MITIWSVIPSFESHFEMSFQEFLSLCIDGLIQYATRRSTRRVQTSFAKADHFPYLNPQSRSTRFVAAWHHALMDVGPWWWQANPKASGSLPTPRSGHGATSWVILLIYSNSIVIVFISLKSQWFSGPYMSKVDLTWVFTHRNRLRSPPPFNQFFLFALQTPP